MSYYFNKLAFGLANPMSVGLLLLLLALVLGCLRRNRLAWTSGLLAFAWLLVWSHPLLLPDVARPLERCYPPQSVEVLPKADAIVLLGGGMSKGSDETVYPEMHEAADRVWQAARLYKAGKAPVIFTSGTNEAFASAVLLKDLGVPDSALVLDPESRNTEENAKVVASLLKSHHASLLLPNSARPSVLLVTSSWHMRRALLTFRKYAEGVEVIPAACDYEALNCKDEFDFAQLFPSADCMRGRSKSLKEWLGYWGYRFRQP